jgi:hypothetical protein
MDCNHIYGISLQAAKPFELSGNGRAVGRCHPELLMVTIDSSSYLWLEHISHSRLHTDVRHVLTVAAVDILVIKSSVNYEALVHALPDCCGPSFRGLECHTVLSTTISCHRNRWQFWIQRPNSLRVSTGLCPNRTVLATVYCASGNAVAKFSSYRALSFVAATNGLKICAATILIS